VDRLIARANADLAGGLGNLVNRIVTMIHRYRDGQVPEARGIAAGTQQLREACADAPGQIDAALADFDFRRTTSALWTIVQAADRCIETTRPWQLAKAERDENRDAAERLDEVLADLLQACRLLADHLATFLPAAAARIARQCATVDGVLPEPHPLFPRIGG
jgi:methionyl-tRNA synthetase